MSCAKKPYRTRAAALRAALGSSRSFGKAFRIYPLQRVPRAARDQQDQAEEEPMTDQSQTRDTSICGECGALVGDPALHRAWHEHVKRCLDIAVGTAR